MAEPSATPNLDRLRNEMNPQQRANFDKMLNHQPRLKKMFNATMRTATQAWESQPSIRVRLAAMAVGDVTRTGAGAVGTAARATQTAVMNPGQTYNNARDAGGRAVNASLDAGGRALTATGRGIAAGTAATGRGIAAGTAATGRGIAAGAAATGRGIANSRAGRWVSDTWSRGTAAAEAGRRAFNEGRANPATPSVSAQDRLDLSDRAVAVVTAQTPEDRLAATQALITQLQAQIDKSNNAGFGNAQAPAAQAVQASAATTGPQQGTQQGAQQGERAQQPDNKKGVNGGVQR
ncbi:hypothetical protein [Kribbella kalugense]|uniref:Uncharacterized protein n=1 Tax=Kribbella kalugense TaxID=2512221 RepID=A0A4R7ZEV0_9ACTN|nr:hypothetical protein [Kribbella kalugense]TDW15615.1 hypothetical protein EV650_7103 [Kribbella kalugense]